MHHGNGGWAGAMRTGPHLESRRMFAFCPQAVIWGDVATWAAAAATTVAVVVALYTSGSARRQVEKIREEENLRAEAERRAKAERLALVFEHELHLQLGELWRHIHWLSDDALETRTDELIAWHNDSFDMPVHVTLLERFANEFEVFKPEVAASLSVALSRWLSMLKILPDKVANKRDLLMLRKVLEHTAQQLVATRKDIRPYAEHIMPDLPPAHM